ncbi:MAG: WYL domain-containing protein, partial [Saprospiraceae bacterium]|nr:WYL domain-containing protein [Saprospiraceae bacterium]
MPQNKNALIRYQVIDQCLRNTRKKWTLNMIKKKVEEALFEKEGIQTISIRTIQSDLFNMRSDKLGYNAPIKVYERSYY